jgi:hypothetical protein
MVYWMSAAGWLVRDHASFSASSSNILGLTFPRNSHYSPSLPSFTILSGEVGPSAPFLTDRVNCVIASPLPASSLLHFRPHPWSAVLFYYGCLKRLSLLNPSLMLSSVLAALRSPSPESEGTPQRPPRYVEEDTTPTSHREILGWYSYGIAAEVFAVCGVGSWQRIS